MSTFKAAVTVLIHGAVIALMLGAGMRSSLRDLLQRPGLLLRALFVLEIAVPVAAMLAITVFRVPSDMAYLLLIAAICPGAPFLVRGVEAKAGRRSLALALLVIVSVAAPLTVPVWLWVLGHLYGVTISISSGDVLRIVVPSVLAPLAVGMLVRGVAPRAAERLAPWAEGFFKVALVMILPVLLFLGGSALLHLRVPAAAAALFVTLAAAWLGSWAGGSAAEDRTAVAVAATNGNPALALLLITVAIPHAQGAALMAAYILFRLVVVWIFTRVRKARRLRAVAAA